MTRQEIRKLSREFNKTNPGFEMSWRDFETAFNIVRNEMQVEYIKQIKNKLKNEKNGN